MYDFQTNYSFESDLVNKLLNPDNKTGLNDPLFNQIGSGSRVMDYFRMLSSFFLKGS